jgi:hypothetical protein
MSDGRTVEDAINQVGTGGGGGGGGGITTELDPIFSASPAAKITDGNITSWNNKVDKVGGKQLSTEDFTTLLKQKLDGLSNYDDTEIQEAVSKLRTDLDTLVSGESSNARKEVVYEGGMEDCVITAMRPNVVYWLESINHVTIDSFEEPLQDSDSYDIFTAVITLGIQGGDQKNVSLTLPDNVLWANGEMPDVSGGVFELSISRISDGYGSSYFAVLTPFKTIA